MEERELVDAVGLVVVVRRRERFRVTFGEDSGACC